MKDRRIITKNHQYWIPLERYKELRYFCLQYDYYRQKSSILFANDPNRYSKYDEYCRMIEDSVKTIGKDAIYILKKVTTDESYDQLVKDGLATDKTYFLIEMYKFFWILDKLRK